MANPTPHSTTANPTSTTTETNTPNIPRVHTTYQPYSKVNNTNTLGKYNYYQALELPNFASVEQVKTAYRELAKRWHPDFHLESSTLAQIAEERFKAINMAYVTLKSPETKALYDEKLRLLLDKIARYIEKRENQPTAVTNTAPVVVSANNVPSAASTPSLTESATASQNQHKKPTPKPNTVSLSSPEPKETLTTPLQFEKAETPEPDIATVPYPNEETGVEKTAKRLRHPNRAAKEASFPTPQATIPSHSNSSVKTDTSAEQPTAASVPLSVRKEPLPFNPTIAQNQTDKRVAEPDTHFDFLQKLRNYLQPSVQPVVLCYTKEKSAIEVEGILTITPQQAKMGKSIRVQLDASHCEKFNLPPIIQVQLPKNLEEGHRLKITEDKWYNNQTDTAKIISVPEADTQQALILVVHIQPKPNSLLSMIADTFNNIKQKQKPLTRSATHQATSTASIVSSNPVSPGRMTNPTVLSESILIPLPLAVLGGAYEFTSQVTQEKISINIPSGIDNNTHLHLGLTNDTLLDICITWQLPDAKTLTKQEKHLYETLLLTAFTTEKRNQSPVENTVNTESPLEVSL